MAVSELIASLSQDARRLRWEVGIGRPMFSITNVVTIRGPRCAAVAFTMASGNDMMIDTLEVFRFDSRLANLPLLVAFDLDAAIAELERAPHRDRRLTLVVPPVAGSATLLAPGVPHRSAR